MSASAQHRRPLSCSRVLAVAIAVLAAGFFVGAASSRSARQPVLHGDVVWPAGKKPAPGFRLHDEHGHLLTLTSENGRVVLLTFMYSRCREICPLEGRMLAAAERRIGSSTRAVLLVVSVDPEGDTPTTIRRFIRRSGLAGSRWHWLVGKRSQLAPVWRASRIEVRAGRNIGHSMPFLPRFVADDVRTLARETG